jgi:hypothetical protein
MYFQSLIKKISTLLLTLSVYRKYNNVVSAQYSGDMTSYGASEENQFCGFKSLSWNYNNLMTAAINMPMIDNSLTCGMCATIKYKDKKETVIIDNLCPECKYGDLDLSNQAWQKITGNSNYGREKMTWEFSNCDNFLRLEEKGLILKPHHINYWWLSITPSNMKCGINNMFIKIKNNNKESDWVQMKRNNNIMNGLYFIYHNHVNGEFRFKILSKFDEVMETEWYSEIKEIFYIKKQFECKEAHDCGDYSLANNVQLVENIEVKTQSPSLRGLNCTTN